MNTALILHALAALDEPTPEERRALDEVDLDGDRIEIEKAYVGYYAYDERTYDGTGPLGHGMTPEEAKADLREQLEDDNG